MKTLEQTVRETLEKKLGKDAKSFLDEKVIISMPNRKDKNNEDT
jgi:hypothetical protein